MKTKLENVKPKEIETRSFEIITEELGDKKLQPGTELIVKRCIHTSADFEYLDILKISDNELEFITGMNDMNEAIIEIKNKLKLLK